VSKFLAVLISFAVVASSFTSAAEAFPGRRLGFFFGGMAAAGMLAHAAEERRREEAYERLRARRIAQERAVAIAAARRERAREIALQKQKAARIAAAEATTTTSPADGATPALKKGDRLPSAQDDTPTTSSTSQTTMIEKTPSDKITTGSTTPAETTTAVTCRKYSATADAVIEVPCN
jgi:hypothetical protein